MNRLQITAIALLTAAAAPAAIAQTKSVNSDTTFSSHGDPQPAQNSGSTSASKKPTASHHRRMHKAPSKRASSALANSAPDLNNMTASAH